MNFTKGVHGPDVSFYQDDDLTPQKIDFQKMKDNGAAFVFLRGGQNTWIDEDFRDYVAGAKAAGLPWGTYWFYDSRSSPETQAALWKIACGDDIPAVIAADLEESYGGAYKGEVFWKRFIHALETEFPTSRICIYTADWWWSGQYVSDPAFFASYPLWVAGYPASEDPADVTLPYPWRNKQAHIWQYTSKGDGPAWGVESLNIDLNYWNDIYDFVAFWGEPLPPDNGGDMTNGNIKGTAKNGTLTNIKPMAGGTAIYQLTGGQYVYGEYSTLQTDIINFDHYYGADGVLHALGVLCKCSVGNLTVIAEQEPGTQPPPAGDINIDITLKSDGTITGTWTEG